MKKLILKTSDLNKSEVLTRAQLKKVLGGDGSGSGSGEGCKSECSGDTDCITPEAPNASCDTYLCDTDTTTTFKVCIGHNNT